MDKVHPAPQAIAGYGKNPFINRTRVLPQAQQLKLVLMGLTLFPLRAILVFALILFAALISAIGTAGLRPADYDKPLAGWRQTILAPLRPTMRLLLVVMGVWITVRGQASPKSVAPIVVCNHRCFLEPIFLMAALGGCAVSAIENARYPLVGPVLIALQSLLVQRDHRLKSKGKTDGEAPPPVSNSAPATPKPNTTIEKIAARAKDPRFGRVLIFPEGTCGNGDAVLQFKTGAFKPGLPVQPVTVEYPFLYFDVSWCR